MTGHAGAPGGHGRTDRGHLPAAVLWDLDGTLVDSGPLWREAYAELASRLGGELTPSTWDRIAGRTMTASVEVVRAGLADGEACTTSELAGWLVGRVEARLAAGAAPAWRPGAAEALVTVQDAGVPTALVTTTWRRVVSLLLLRLDIGFDTIVCGDEITRGKPDPEPYLLAARRLGVGIADCLVVEDSPTGVAAGEAAGARVLAVPSAADIAPAAGRTVRPSLAGLTLNEVAAAGGTA